MLAEPAVPSHRRLPAWRARAVLFAGLAVLALALYAFLLGYLVVYAMHAPRDFFQDYISARQLLEGRPLYPDLAPFRAAFPRPPEGFGDVEWIEVNAHPPVSILLVLPLALLPYPTASLLWEVGGLLAYAATWWLLMDGLQLYPRSRRGWLALLLGALLHPALFPSVLYATMSPCISLLLVATWACYRRGQRTLAALFLALATALKLYPALLIGVWLLRRDWRTAALTVVSTFGVLLLSLPVLTPAAYREYLAVLPRLGWWITLPGNWSLAGFFGRLFTVGPATTPLAKSPLAATLLTMLAGAGVIGLCVLAALRAPDDGSVERFDVLFASGLLALLLLSPLAWAHYTTPVVLAWCCAARGALRSGCWSSRRGRLLVALALGMLLFPLTLIVIRPLVGADAAAGQASVGPLTSLLFSSFNTYALLALLLLTVRPLQERSQATASSVTS